MKNILVTGGAGFIGSNFINYLLEKDNSCFVYNLDCLTYAGNLNNLSLNTNNDRYKFIEGNICNREFVEFIFKEYLITDVYHFAAESHVDNSISGPEAFVKTNVLGTFNLLDTARKAWMIEPFVCKDGCKTNRFLHVSTDEVYGTLGDTGLFQESTPYAPNSPYSASKASSDLLVRSYFHTFGMNVVTTNCSNNYGPNQHDEKLIPTVIRKALSQQPIPVYGDGKNIRDWLYVKDHCSGIHLAHQQGEAGETYNIGGRNERDNNYIVEHICEILDQKEPLQSGVSYSSFIKYVKDRAGHDKRYAIDATKIESELKWTADENFETGIIKTVEWYIKKYKENN